MDCIICRNWFSSLIHDGACPTCSRAIKQLGLNMTPNRILELAQAEKNGQLVVQKHGQWETHLLPLAWKCSVCGFKNSFRSGRTTEYLNYCPCCGAKMDKEEDNEAVR